VTAVNDILYEAHGHDLDVIAHVFYHDDAEELVAAGVDGFAHLVRDREMDDALVAAIVENDVFVMPNIGISERVSFGPDRRQGLQQVYYTVVESGRFVTLESWEDRFAS